MTVQFKKAVKYEAKGRVALVGPAGSGKSWTGLTLARTLVGPEGKIAAIDTEHGSLSKYADQFDFDVMELSSFSPTSFLDALKSAEAAGYNAFMCDSLSHFWVGKDGALEFVDMAAKRYKDNMGGWKEFRPHERQMVDAMIASPLHIIVTMRTKTDYQEQVDPHSGKKKRVKVGLAPVQREGLEYEFDLVGYMDDENTLITDKTRCSFYSGKALSKPAAKDFAPFAEWLKGAAAPVAPKQETPPPPATPPASTGGFINVNEQNELFRLIKTKNVPLEKFRTHLRDTYGIEKTSEIRSVDYIKVTEWILKNEVPDTPKPLSAMIKPTGMEKFEKGEIVYWRITDSTTDLYTTFDGKIAEIAQKAIDAKEHVLVEYLDEAKGKKITKMKETSKV